MSEPTDQRESPFMLTVELRELRGDHYGLTNGRDRIWIDTRTTPQERFETLLHEVGHIILGHIDGAPPADVDDAIEQIALRAYREFAAIGEQR